VRFRLVLVLELGFVLVLELGFELAKIQYVSVKRNFKQVHLTDIMYVFFQSEKKLFFTFNFPYHCIIVFYYANTVV